MYDSLLVLVDAPNILHNRTKKVTRKLDTEQLMHMPPPFYDHIWSGHDLDLLVSKSSRFIQGGPKKPDCF